MKNTWKGIKNILNLGHKDVPQLTQINYKRKHLSSNLEMANVFNNVFTNVGHNLDELIPTNKSKGSLTVISKPKSLIHFYFPQLTHRKLVISLII